VILFVVVAVHVEAPFPQGTHCETPLTVRRTDPEAQLVTVTALAELAVHPVA